MTGAKPTRCWPPWWSVRRSRRPRPTRPMRAAARADGAYGNGPSRERAASQGFRLEAPGRGKKRPGVGKVRNAVERCHNFFAQFGRVGRRLDRNARNYLGWCQLAACVIFIRSGFVR